MRCIMKASFPVEPGNEAMRSGKLQKTIESFVKELKPEAAYFIADHGQRTGLFVLDLKSPSEIPMVAEPFFLALNASIEFFPAMNLEDLMKAGPHIQDAIKKYA
jgi:hypothetical protein